MTNKEKVCHICHQTRERCNDNEYCHNVMAEPKPTPSTPANEEAQPLPARVGSVAAYIGITEDQVRRFVGAMNMVGLEIVETVKLYQQ